MKSSEVEFREKLLSVLESHYGSSMEYPMSYLEEIIFAKIGELKGKVEVLEKIVIKPTV